MQEEVKVGFFVCLFSFFFFLRSDLQSHTSHFCLFLVVQSELLSLAHTQEKGTWAPLFARHVKFCEYLVNYNVFYLIINSICPPLLVHFTNEEGEVQRDKVICCHSWCTAELRSELCKSVLLLFFAFCLHGTYVT